MGFRIRSIELSNIRSHDYLFFAPATQGITSIVGKNGTGKSTIVDSIAWCLFGVKMGGSKNSDTMKHGVAYKKGEFYARVLLEVDGQNLLVSRSFVSKGGTLESDVYHIADVPYDDSSGEVLPIDVATLPESAHAAGPAVSHAESYLRQRLQMDQKGFLASILVQQKEVDRLVKASARERAQVIEDLTGVTAVTDALDMARREQRDLKNASTLTSVDADLIKDKEKEASDIRRDMNVKVQSLEWIAEEVSEIQSEGKELKQKKDDAQRRLSAYQEAEKKKALLEDRYSSRMTDKQELLEDRDDRKKKLGEVANPEVAQRIISDRDRVQKENNTAQSEVQTMRNHLTSLREEREECRELMERTELQGYESFSALSDAQQEEFSHREADIVKVRDRIASFQQSRRSYENAVEILSSESGECPTCLQVVEDSQKAVSALQDSITEAEREVSDSEEVLEQLEEQKAQLSEGIKLSKKAADAEKRIGELDAQVKEKSKELEYLLGVERDSAEQLKGLSERAQEAQRHMTMIEEYHKVREKVQAVTKETNTLKLQLDEVRDEISQMASVSQSSVDALEKKYHAKRDEYMKKTNEQTQMKGELSAVKQTLLYEEREIAKLREDYEKHQKMMEKLEIATHAVQVTEEFRRDRIENSVPVIEDYASDFLSKFSDGKFLRVKVDNKFNTSVVLRDGKERSVSALSGGELSAAAIALRLAISVLIGGSGKKSSMILDEVLVSMDDERSSNILHTIQEVAQGQVILIAHSESINTVADNVFTL